MECLDQLEVAEVFVTFGNGEPKKVEILKVGKQYPLAAEKCWAMMHKVKWL